jgi:drug/metabolite transporter (DMT)-like permease
VIAAYTLVDGRGVRAGGDAAAYVAALFVLNALPFAVTAVARRGWQRSWQHARARGVVAAVGAAASLAAYGIALWAMTRAPVAVVAALRETSVLFAALLGTWMLRERFGLRHGAGVAGILLGLVALRLG